MTTAFLAPSPLQGTLFIPGGNTPAAGGQLFFYIAGSSTKQTAYRDNAAATPWSNPLVLDSGGMAPSGGEIWFLSGVSYKVVFAPATDTDPPSSPYWTKDNLTGTGDGGSSAADQWVASAVTPTFVNSTSFTLPGDQTATFQAGRRLRTANTAGSIYSTISSAVFASSTTVQVFNDTGALDTGLSGVSYGLISALQSSLPGNIPYLRPQLIKFTSTGVYSKPANMIGALVITKGAGASGGGSSTAAAHGGGGGEGEIVWKMLAASSLAATTAVTIGTGGSAIGNGVASTGVAGSVTSFGAFATAAGGSGGAPGHNGGAGGVGGTGGTGDWSQPGAVGQAGADAGGATIAINSAGGGQGGGAAGGNAVANSGAGGGGGSTAAGSGTGANGVCVLIQFY